MTVVNTKVIPTNTFLAATPVPTKTFSVTLTSEPPCDPFTVDFCIAAGHFILQRPIHAPGNDLVDPTYAYGSTADGTRDPHHGVEFSNPSGTPVYAAASGTVLFAGADIEAIYSPWPNYYGNLVVIQHSDELFTLYAHLSKVEADTGQRVFAGDTIGEVGRTGVAIGSHLHFEVRHGNSEDYFATQNPDLWLIPAKDKKGNLFGALVISVVNQDHHLIKHAEFTIQYYPDQTQQPAKFYYRATYSPDLLNGDENAALGDLSPGRYRIAVTLNGQVYERWVEVESGKLTQVVIVVN